MIILAIDFETNGTDPLNSEILEIGAVLWDSETKQPLSMFSSLICPKETHFIVNEDVKQITGIEEKDLYLYGISEENVITKLYELANKATSIVSHFGIEFDRIVFERLLSSMRFSLSNWLWIDTGFDIIYPKKIKLDAWIICPLNMDIFRFKVIEHYPMF